MKIKLFSETHESTQWPTNWSDHVQWRVHSKSTRVDQDFINLYSALLHNFGWPHDSVLSLVRDNVWSYHYKSGFHVVYIKHGILDTEEEIRHYYATEKLCSSKKLVTVSPAVFGATVRSNRPQMGSWELESLREGGQ